MRKYTSGLAIALALLAVTCQTAFAQAAPTPPAQGLPHVGTAPPAQTTAQADDPVTPAPPAVVATATDAAPQDAAPEPTKPTRGFFSALGHNLLDDVKHLPRRNSVYWLAGGGALALAVHPADQTLNERLTGSTFADHFFIPGKYAGATEVQVAASLTTYIVGRAKHHPRVQHLGMDLLEAQLLAEGIVEGAKVAIRRQRPLNPDGTRFPGYSFPSGHATVTFASATVLQQHLGWKAAVPTYLLATYVAASRLHDNRHFASDVVFGAATGIIIGRSVTWHGRNTYTLSAAALPNGIGAIVTW